MAKLDQPEKLKQYIEGCRTCSEVGLEEHIHKLNSVIEKHSSPRVKKILHMFKAMGNKVRTKILLLLLQRDEVCAAEFVVVLDLSQPNISHHLNILEQANLISNYSQGKWKFYRITDLGKTIMKSLDLNQEN